MAPPLLAASASGSVAPDALNRGFIGSSSSDANLEDQDSVATVVEVANNGNYGAGKSKRTLLTPAILSVSFQFMNGGMGGGDCMTVFLSRLESSDMNRMKGSR